MALTSRINVKVTDDLKKMVKKRTEGGNISTYIKNLIYKDLKIKIKDK